MQLIDGFVCWDSTEDEESFLAMCEPFADVPSDAQAFIRWLGKVVHSHAKGSPDKQLLAVYLTLLLSELAPEYLVREDQAHSVFPNRFIGDAGSISHVLSSFGKVGYAGYLH